MTEPTSASQYRTRKDRTIFRVEKNKENPFVMMDRRPLENVKLSWSAKGVLAYLLSRPDDWVIRRSDLINRSTDGDHIVRRSIKELKNAGHITITQNRSNGKAAGWTYHVYEMPLHVENQHVEKPHVEKPHVEKPHVENQPITNTESTNTDSTNMIDTGFKKIVHELETLCGGLASNTADLIQTWLEKHTLEWILKAIEEARAHGAKSPKYVDRVLVGWEANGYPQTRDEQIRSAKKAPTKAAAKAQAAFDSLKALSQEYAQNGE